MIRTADPFNAFLDYGQTAVSNAASGPLSGLTLAVKDIFDVVGYPSGWGNPQHVEETGPAAATTPAVQTLFDAGARFIGKTQTDELAFSLMGQNGHFPYPINPRAPDRVTGGSSSGSAAAVAGSLADIAVGSDTGGSIRAPASFCGLIGLRTTHGAISLAGTMALAPSLDCFGWFAKDMATYRKVAQVLLGGRDAPHPYSLPVKYGESEASTLAPPAPRISRGEGKREGQFRLLRSAELDALVLPDAEAEYSRLTSRIFEQFGSASNAPAPPHSIDDLYWCFRRIQSFEAWRVHGDWLSAKDRQLSIGVTDRFELARTITADTYETEGVQRRRFASWLVDLLGDDGILVLPTVPSAAPRAAEPHDSLQVYRERALCLLCWSGLAGLPQLTLPLGQVAGAPFGISLLGPAGSDLALLELGADIMADAA